MSPAARAASRASAAAAPAQLPRQPRPKAHPPGQARPTTPAERTRSTAVARPQARAGAQQQRRLSFGVFWIGVAGLLLTGVVAVSVVALRQNVQLDQATRERTRLRAENAGLASRVSAAVAASRIEGLAQRSFGLVPASAQETTFLDLRSAK